MTEGPNPSNSGKLWLPTPEEVLARSLDEEPGLADALFDSLYESITKPIEELGDHCFIGTYVRMPSHWQDKTGGPSWEETLKPAAIVGTTDDEDAARAAGFDITAVKDEEEE